MSFIGKWKVQEVGVFGAQGFTFCSVEEYLNMPLQFADPSVPESVELELEERRKNISTAIAVREDGSYATLMPIPEGIPKEDVDSAVASGDIILIEGMIALEVREWELRDGEFYHNTGDTGEIMGEAIDGWMKADYKDGLLQMGMFKYKRVD